MTEAERHHMTGREPGIAGKIARRVRFARGALAWERLWSALWPMPAIIGLFVAIALSDMLPQLPGWMHALVLAGFGVGVVVIGIRAARRFTWPGVDEGERRVERTSGLSHRPLEALRDRPATRCDDPEIARLWRDHLRRITVRLGPLRAGAPRSDLVRRDPTALRILVAVLLVVAVITAGSDGAERLARSLSPNFAVAAVVVPTLDLWIEPPAYTGVAPVYAGDDRTTLAFPAGSTLKARVSGGRGVPALVVDGERAEFAAFDAMAHQIERQIAAGGELSVEQGGTVLGTWAMDVTRDAPPRVTQPRDPVRTERNSLRIEYLAEDDYGVTDVVARIVALDGDGVPVTGEPLDLRAPIAAGDPTVRGTVYRDLTAHRWAGEPVELAVVATDGAGQTGISDTVHFHLPERAFTHPVAKAIVEQRRALDRKPEARREVATRLGGIARMTGLYDDDIVVYLALSSSMWRLRYDQRQEALEGVRDLLWDTALRLEDGNLSLAERELRAAQQELMEALARNAPQDEIDRLLDQLAQAMERYLQSLMAGSEELEDIERMQQEGRIVEQRDLQELLQRLRDLTRAGSRQAAMQLMQQLQNILENLRRAQPGGGGDMQAETQRMMQMMQQLQSLSERQQGLMDRTFQDMQRQQGRPSEGQSGEGLAGEQDALRRALGEFMRQLGEQMGEIPGPLGRAEQAMRDAIGALDQGRSGDAVGPQGQALDQLQQAGRSMAREFARQLGVGTGQGQANQQDPGQRADPLGRPRGDTGIDAGDVGIPDESALQRARRIRDELQRRAGDRARPAIERDYIDRLLQEF